MLGTINCARLWCLGAVDAGRQLRSTNGTQAANKCDAVRGESSKSSERSESAAGLAAWMLQQGSSDYTGGTGQLQATLDAGRNPLILIARHTEWRPGITSRQWAASQLFAHGRWTKAPVIRSRRGPIQQVRACSFLLRRTNGRRCAGRSACTTHHCERQPPANHQRTSKGFCCIAYRVALVGH